MINQILDRTNATWLDKQYSTQNNLEDRITLHRICGTDGGRWQEWLFDILLQHAPLQAKVLEVGGGTGQFWIKNTERIPKDWEIIFSDRSEGMVKIVREYLKDDRRFLLKTLDASQPFDFQDAAFDIVVANHMLYHVENLDQCIREIFRILKPGGLFFASAVGVNHMKRIYELVHEFYPEFAENRVRRHFNLQGGKEKLDPYFASVEVVTPQNKLIVQKEHLPLLIRYALSFDEIKNIIGEHEVESFYNFLLTKLDENGTIVIPKEEVLFIGKK